MAGTVTRLEVQKKNKDRVNVFLDDEFAFGLALILAATLHKGQRLTDEDIAELRRQDGLEKAYNRALLYLGYRPRSEAEIRQYLRGKQTPDDMIDTILTRLRRVGLVNDEAFAQAWVRHRGATSPRGARALRQELRQKGIDRPQIDAAVEDLDEEEGALEAARPRAARLAALPPEEFRRKLSEFLLRRGFAYDVVRETVSRLWRELHDEGLVDDDD